MLFILLIGVAREHIRWAEENGALEAVAAFLHGLPEEDWNHIGEWPSSG